MTIRYDERGRPAGLDWTVINAGCPQDPSVWKKAAAVKPKPQDTSSESEVFRLHKEGASPVEIAEELELSAATVTAILGRRRPKTSDDTVAEVIRLYTIEELGGSAIRERLGLAHGTIYKILRRNGIPTRRAA